MKFLPRVQPQPPMVPLADMLTNTVGITIFILIFVVLLAGGASYFKYLPYEHASNKRAVFQICKNNQYYYDDLIKLFKDNYVNGNSIVINSQPKKTAHFELTMYFMGSIAIKFSPLAGAGTSLEDMVKDRSEVLNSIKQYDPASTFPFFFVYPDSIPCFETARRLWVAHGFGYGWVPRGADGIVAIGLGGGGQAPVEE